MAAIDSFTPQAATVIRLFAHALRSAPTADLVNWGATELGNGLPAADLLEYLFNYPVPQSPFTAYSRIASDQSFCTALVDNFSFGTTIGASVKAGWVTQLLAELPHYRSHGELAAAISQLVAGYAGTDTNLLTLRDALATRVESAAQFVQSPAGAVYDGKGFGQLMAPLLPAEPSVTLQRSAAAVDEGGSVTFTLDTQHIAAGTQLAYTLSGDGIGTGDVASGLLSGQITIGADGRGSLVVSLVADATTEGSETLRLTLADGLGQIDVAINDTSLTPPTPPTFALTATAGSRDEGGSVTYTLTTTHLAAGTPVAYALSGSGITAADIVGGALSGFFVVDAQGTASVTLTFAADSITEGQELLHLALSGNVATIDTVINDTSLTPPVGTPDLLLIADNMNNNQAHPPGSPAEGEIPLDTYLTVDLLRHVGIDDVRMTVAALKQTNPVAGAPLDPTNFSADRGNIPQLSNQSLFTFDLGAQTDRVDYSAESGKIVALVTTQAATATQYVLVNDDGTDDVFSGATDRMDTLKNVEEVVASRGGGVIDLTASARDWQISFSRHFNAATDVDAALDRETHRVELTELGSGTPYARTLLEFRDAGQSSGVTQATAAWTVVQGSDHDETLIFTGAEAADARTNVLRGGSNAAKFNELTRSILVDVAIVPWVSSTNPADDTNPTGRTVATVTPTTGDGVTPLSGNTLIVSSHTPDNRVAAGSLQLVGSQDAEDAISFNSTPQPKVITLGLGTAGVDSASVRLAAGPDSAALTLSGFESLRDNGATDDVYVVSNIFRATQGSPRLSDGAAADHDTVRLGNEALGSAAVGGSIAAVNLATLVGPSPGFGVDFDVLDLSAITSSGLQAMGTAGTDDELVVGALGTLSAVTLFESLVLTHGSTDKGSALVFDLDAGAVKVGSSTLFAYSGSILSAGGLVLGTPGQANTVTPMDSGLNITVVDSTAGSGATVWGGSAADLITGGAGDDRLRGGGGNDTLDGGLPAAGASFSETWAFTLNGTPDAVAAAANRITVAMTIDGTALTLTEAAVADSAYGDGNGAVLDGASTATIGTAMAALINANLASVNAGPGTGTLTGASYDSTSRVLLLSFQPGVNANDVVTFVLNSGAGPDGGNFSLSAGVNVNGGNGGVDTFVFEKTAALNGRDTILNFTAGSDKLDVSAFAGAAINAASPALDAAVGGSMAGVPTTAEFIFAKAQATLSSNDFATSGEPGKFVLADGGRCVVLVTADPTGSRGDSANTAVNLYFVENGVAAGLSDLTVSLVGVLTGPLEPTIADLIAALG